MKKINVALLIAGFLSLLLVTVAFAQNEELSISFSRDFGYSSGTGDIQGTFSMKVSGPADLARVEFYIDDTRIGEDGEAPFRIQFVTDNYPLGMHEMYAVGFSEDGREYRSRVVTANFVTAEEGWQAAGKIAIPLIAVVFGAILLSVGVPMLMGRGKLQELPLGAERKYGVGGGGICPKCQRPFALPLFSMHLGFSKLARCPYCCKVGAVRVQPLQKLRQAEQAELEGAKGQAPEASAEEKLARELDDSKYQGI
jgi:hypothetical protein